MNREWHLDPVKLVLCVGAITAAVTEHFTTGIILAALAGTTSLQMTWKR